jgi:hypothetical protein
MCQQFKPYQIPQYALHCRFRRANPFRLNGNRYLRIWITHDEIHLGPATRPCCQWGKDGMLIFSVRTIAGSPTENLADRMCQVLFAKESRTTAGTLKLKPSADPNSQKSSIVDQTAALSRTDVRLIQLDVGEAEHDQAGVDIDPMNLGSSLIVPTFARHFQARRVRSIRQASNIPPSAVTCLKS